MILVLLLYQSVQISENAEVSDKKYELTIFKEVEQVDFMGVPVSEGSELIKKELSVAFW